MGGSVEQIVGTHVGAGHGHGKIDFDKRVDPSI